MKIVLLLFSLLASSVCFGESYSSVLLSKQTGKPIAYANVGIAEKNVGAVTDEEGRFSLPLDETRNSEMIRISMIGFEPRELKVTDFKKIASAGEVLYLVQRDLRLGEVVVKSRRMHHRLLGNTADNKHHVFGFEQYRPGYEVGTFIRIRRSPTFIDSVRIKVAKCDYDSVFFRLNIYEIVDGVFRNVLNEPLYIHTDTATAMKDITVDLVSRNIVVKHNFLVSVELVKDLGGKEMYFCAEAIGAKGYMRMTSQAAWQKFIFGPSFSAYVTD